MMWQKKSAVILILLIVFYPISVLAGSKVDLEKGIKLFNSEKYTEARKIFTDIVNKDSKNSEGWYYLGRICFIDRDYDKAIKWFKKAIDINENISKYHEWLANAYGNEINNVGKIKQAFMARKIKKEFEKAVELDANNNQARLDLMLYYLYAPGIAGGSKKKAYKLAIEIKKRDPKMGHEAYINIYRAEKKYDLAEKEYVALIQKDPNNFDYHSQHAWFYINIKDYEKAYKKLIKMIEEYPEKSMPYYAIGYMATMSDRYSEYAEECMLKLFNIISTGTENHPKQRLAWFHYLLGTIYKKNGKNDLARREYETALNLNPDYKEVKEALNKI